MIDAIYIAACVVGGLGLAAIVDLLIGVVQMAALQSDERDSK
jgi:ABC-type glucose/galactose transport system permease subunit